MTKDEMVAIISLAKKLIIKLEEEKTIKENKILRDMEDHHDLTDVIGYQKCEDCND
jgi:hypothetical protein